MASNGNWILERCILPHICWSCTKSSWVWLKTSCEFLGILGESNNRTKQLNSNEMVIYSCSSWLQKFGDSQEKISFSTSFPTLDYIVYWHVALFVTCPDNLNFYRLLSYLSLKFIIIKCWKFLCLLILELRNQQTAWGFSYVELTGGLFDSPPNLKRRFMK